MRWTDAEIALLRKHYADEAGRLVKRLPGRTRTQIVAKARQLNLRYRNLHVWQPGEIKILKKHYKKGRQALKTLLPHLSQSQIDQKTFAMGLILEPRLRWTAEEDKILHKFYVTDGADYVGDILVNRSRHSIQCRASIFKLNQKKSKKFIDN